MTIRQGSERFFSKPEVACALRIHGATFTAKNGSKIFRLRLCVSLPISVSVLALLTTPRRTTCNGDHGSLGAKSYAEPLVIVAYLGIRH